MANYQGLVPSEDAYSRVDSNFKSPIRTSASHSYRYTQVCHYRAQVVAVKKVTKPYIYLTKDILQELNEVI